MITAYRKILQVISRWGSSLLDHPFFFLAPLKQTSQCSQIYWTSFTWKSIQTQYCSHINSHANVYFASLPSTRINYPSPSHNYTLHLLNTYTSPTDLELHNSSKLNLPPFMNKKKERTGGSRTHTRTKDYRVPWEQLLTPIFPFINWTIQAQIVHFFPTQFSLEPLDLDLK